MAYISDHDLALLRQRADGYEYLRRLAAREFMDLYNRCITQDVKFDDAVQDAIKRKETTK